MPTQHRLALARSDVRNLGGLVATAGDDAIVWRRQCAGHGHSMVNRHLARATGAIPNFGGFVTRSSEDKRFISRKHCRVH